MRTQEQIEAMVPVSDRAGSTKRVASAVGEGAAVVAQIHSILGAAATSA
jgi:thioredoxin reductase (NADPH)